MILILTRHGETVENVTGIIQGQTDGHLTEKGVQQAKLLAKRLKDEKIDVIYSSDLGRTRNTTKEIIKFHKCPVHYIKELRERYLASFEGKHFSEVPWGDQPGDLETLEAMRERAKKLIDTTYDKHPNETVLFVGHGALNSMMLSVIKNVHFTLEQYRKGIQDQKNTAVSIFELTEDKNHKIHILNCDKHLSVADN